MARKAKVANVRPARHARIVETVVVIAATVRATIGATAVIVPGTTEAIAVAEATAVAAAVTAIGGKLKSRP
jgi:hypothetical protein